MIWCVEDDDSIRELVLYTLHTTGFEAEGFADAPAFFTALAKKKPALILLDIMLPRLNGQQLCAGLRQQGIQTPILMLTSLDALPDKLASFAAGADDYLVKPFELAELVARIRALSLRRSGQTSRLQVDDLVMELTTRKVSRAGQELHLSPICWALLEHLMRASPEPVPRERLESKIWGDEPPDSNTLKVHMHRLRKAVDKPFGRPLIHSLAGVGIQVKAHA